MRRIPWTKERCQWTTGHPILHAAVGEAVGQALLVFLNMFGICLFLHLFFHFLLMVFPAFIAKKHIFDIWKWISVKILKGSLSDVIQILLKNSPALWVTPKLYNTGSIAKGMCSISRSGIDIIGFFSPTISMICPCKHISPIRLIMIRNSIILF